jgi:hypothetical protein
VLGVDVARAHSALAPSFRMPDAEKLAFRKTFHEGKFKTFSALLEKRLTTNASHGPYYVGSKLTIADLKANQLFEMVTSGEWGGRGRGGGCGCVSTDADQHHLIVYTGRLDGIPSTSFEPYAHILANGKAVGEALKAVRPAAK